MKAEEETRLGREQGGARVCILGLASRARRTIIGTSGEVRGWVAVTLSYLAIGRVGRGKRSMHGMLRGRGG